MTQKILTALSFFVFCSSLVTADTIVRYSGAANKGVTVTEVTHENVKFTSPGISTTQTAPAHEVQEIKYSDASSLQTAYELLNRGMYNEARDRFRQVNGKPFLAEEGDYGAAYVSYRKYEDTGKHLDEAITRLTEYIGGYKEKLGFHLPQAHFYLANLYLAKKDDKNASAQLDALAAFSGTSREILSELGKGKIELQKGSVKQASTTFYTLLQRTKSQQMDKLHKMAVCLRGTSLVAEKRFDEAIEFLNDFVRESKDDKVKFDKYAARAFNILGSAFSGKGGSESEWKALYKYLWTTVIFRHCRAESAEAFYHAHTLAKKLGKTSDAAQLKANLLRFYADTKWADQVQ